MPASALHYPGAGQMGRDSMNCAQPTDKVGRLEARYSAFLETITNLRPILHRYCARTTASVMSEKGKITLQDTFLGARFRMRTDRFGVNCMFNFRTGTELCVVNCP